MTDFERLAQAAYHRERVASRRLARANGITEHEALRLTMQASAGQGTLAELLQQRESAIQASLARTRERRARQIQAHQHHKARHDGVLTPWRAWFDGSAHPNPGNCSIGAVLQGPGGQQHTISRQAGYGNSSEAEYRALIAVLEAAVAAGADDLTVYGDSQGVIDDMQSGSGAASLAALRQTAQDLMSALPIVTLRWVPRHKNGHADALSQQAARGPDVMR
jgi:ribonuclease HI